MIKDGIDATSVEGVADSPYLKDDAEPPASSCTRRSRRSRPVVALGRPHAHRVRDGDADRRAGARRGPGPARYRRALLAKHPRHLGVARARRREGGLGHAAAAGPRPRPRGARVVRQLRRAGRGGLGRGRADPRPPRGLRRRLRHRGQPGGRRRADRGRRSPSACRPRCTARSRCKDGRVQQSNFHDYRSLRMNEMPAVEVHIVPSTEKPSGVGEPGVPPHRAGGRERGLRRHRASACGGCRCVSPEEAAMKRTPARRSLAPRVAAAARPAAAPTRARGTEPRRPGRRFETVRKVLQHPRCQNCHIPGDAPLQCDDGRAHGRTSCAARTDTARPACRARPATASRNPPASYGPNMPPGRAELAPAAARARRWSSSASRPAELCAHRSRIRRQNGGKDLAALLEHVDDDKLVLWGWDPGVGRAPGLRAARGVRRGFRTWVAAGAPCPVP